MSTKTIIWDFDGTLVLHEGLWSGAMMVALNELFDNHDISIDYIKPFLNKKLIQNFPLSMDGGIIWKDFSKQFSKN